MLLTVTSVILLTGDFYIANDGEPKDVLLESHVGVCSWSIHYTETNHACPCVWVYVL